MPVQFVDLFDFRKERNIGALAGLALAGFATWAVRGLIITLLQTCVDPATASEFAYVFVNPFGLDRFFWSVSHWFAFAVILAGVSRLVRRDSVFIGLFAFSITIADVGISFARARLIGQPGPTMGTYALVNLIDNALLIATVVLVFRLTRRIGPAFVIGMPAGSLVGSAWYQLAELASRWHQEVPLSMDAEESFVQLFFATSGAFVVAVSGLMLWVGHAVDRRLRGRPREAVSLPSTGPMSRGLFVGGLEIVFILSLFFGALGFGFLAVRAPDRAVVALVLWLPLLVLEAVLIAMMIHKMWTAIPAGRARTTPGRAAGLLFVPLFNFYWLFQATAGFATDWNNLHSGEGQASRRLPRWLFVTISVLAVVLAIASLFVDTLESMHPPVLPVAVFWHAVISMILWVLWVVVASLVCDAVNGLTPEQLQESLAQSAAIPLEKKAPPRWRTPVIIAALVLLVALTCTGGYFVYRASKAEDSLIIINGDEMAVRGTVEVEFDSNFQPRPVIVKAGRLVLFRTDATIHGGSGRAGEAYRWDEDLQLQRVGTFDLTKSDDELFQQYGVKAGGE